MIIFMQVLISFQLNKTLFFTNDVYIYFVAGKCILRVFYFLWKCNNSLNQFSVSDHVCRAMLIETWKLEQVTAVRWFCHTSMMSQEKGVEIRGSWQSCQDRKNSHCLRKMSVHEAGPYSGGNHENYPEVTAFKGASSW